MTYPRSHTVAPDLSGVYHCISRCVRRAWLCGHDELTGRSFEHRKTWIEERLFELTGVFAVELWGYAIMSNHYHVVVTTKPEQAATWSNEEVADRWLRLCKASDAAHHERRLAAILANDARVEVLRKRLANLSWFMRYINEPLARWANREDGCTGRFWQGRFRSETLLDEQALLTAMTYVDLNPLRAGVVDVPEAAIHTSLASRLKPSAAFGNCLGQLENLGLTTSAYVDLVRWAARDDRLAQPTPATVLRHMSGAKNWQRRFDSLRLHRRAHGSVTALRQFAEVCGQRWFKGITAAPTH